MNTNKHSRHELKRLVEQAVREIGRFDERGVWLCVDELESSGRPIGCIRIWATLHFLSAGSPFDSDDVDLWLWPLREEIADRLRRQLGLLVIRLIALHASTVFSEKPGSRWSPLLPYQAEAQ